MPKVSSNDWDPCTHEQRMWMWRKTLNPHWFNVEMTKGEMGAEIRARGFRPPVKAGVRKSARPTQAPLLFEDAI